MTGLAMDDAENEILATDFTVAEVWQRLPIFLKDEIFGYLNVQHGNRLSRVAADWEVSLSRHALFNRGMVFFQWPEKPFEHFCWGEEQVEQFFWKEDGLKLKEGTVKHFVILDMTATRCLYQRDVIGGKISGLLQPISTVTFYRSEIFSGLLERSAERLLEKTSERLRFLECSFMILMADFFFLPKNTSSGWTDSRPPLERKNWCFGALHPLRTLTKDHVQITNSLPHKQYNWWMLGETLSDYALLWPYPKEQLQWLEKALEMLIPHPAFPLTISKHVQILATRRKWLNLEDDSKLPKTELTFCGNPFSVLDCAIAARLLTCISEIPRPPYELPDDM